MRSLILIVLGALLVAAPPVYADGLAQFDCGDTEATLKVLPEHFHYLLTVRKPGQAPVQHIINDDSAGLHCQPDRAHRPTIIVYHNCDGSGCNSPRYMLIDSDDRGKIRGVGKEMSTAAVRTALGYDPHGGNWKLLSHSTPMVFPATRRNPSSLPPIGIFQGNWRPVSTDRHGMWLSYIDAASVQRRNGIATYRSLEIPRSNPGEIKPEIVNVDQIDCRKGTQSVIKNYHVFGTQVSQDPALGPPWPLFVAEPPRPGNVSWNIYTLACGKTPEPAMVCSSYGMPDDCFTFMRPQSHT